jgi:hypothetical protein
MVETHPPFGRLVDCVPSGIRLVGKLARVNLIADAETVFGEVRLQLPPTASSRGLLLNKLAQMVVCPEVQARADIPMRFVDLQIWMASFSKVEAVNRPSAGKLCRTTNFLVLKIFSCTIKSLYLSRFCIQ